MRINQEEKTDPPGLKRTMAFMQANSAGSMLSWLKTSRLERRRPRVSVRGGDRSGNSLVENIACEAGGE